MSDFVCPAKSFDSQEQFHAKTCLHSLLPAFQNFVNRRTANLVKRSKEFIQKEIATTCVCPTFSNKIDNQCYDISECGKEVSKAGTLYTMPTQKNGIY